MGDRQGVLSPRNGLLWWLVASILAMLVGALGPWARVFGLVNVGGLDGDGWFVLGAAIGAGVMLFLHAKSARAPGWPVVGMVAAGVLGAGVAAVDIAELVGSQSFGEGGEDLVGPGWGIWLSAIASASLALAAVIRFVTTGEPKAP